MNEHEFLADRFEAHRAHLKSVAYRMLGSLSEADDAVQEAWLRLSRSDTDEVRNLGGWLTTVVGRVCLDMLRSRTARREDPLEEHLPDPVVGHTPGTDPERAALVADSVGLALLVVLQSLGPAERLAFVLHDMFAVPFEEIGQIIGKSTDATKMLASRARRKVQDTPRPTDEPQQQRAVVDAFLSAARSGDFEGLLRVLDPDVTWRSYTARGVVVRLGAAEVAGRAQHGTRTALTARPALVNGESGIVVWGANGRLLGVMACTVVDGRIVEILSVSDPERLASMSVPAPPD